MPLLQNKISRVFLCFKRWLEQRHLSSVAHTSYDSSWLLLQFLLFVFRMRVPSLWVSPSDELEFVRCLCPKLRAICHWWDSLHASVTFSTAGRGDHRWPRWQAQHLHYVTTATLSLHKLSNCLGDTPGWDSNLSSRGLPVLELVSVFECSSLCCVRVCVFTQVSLLL